ncbi:MAG: hypothetical protein ABR540_19895 [Acidimicrobiales bacterium]
MSGEVIRRSAWWGTAAFSVTAVAAAAAPDTLAAPAFVVAVALFLAGCAAFVAAYATGIRRSRREQISVANLYFLTGDIASAAVRRSLLGALAVQVVVALATAIARPSSSLAAGTLVPVYGLGLCGLWASLHGTFEPHPERDAGATG